jgi:hypothetical protein
MPHVISLQCANPECDSKIESEEIGLWEGQIVRGAELMEGLERDATLDGWHDQYGQLACPRCNLVHVSRQSGSNYEWWRVDDETMAELRADWANT